MRTPTQMEQKRIDAEQDRRVDQKITKALIDWRFEDDANAKKSAISGDKFLIANSE